MPPYIVSPAVPAAGTTTEAITAFAGGGQTGAFQLVSRYNSVTVVATAADSVKLPPFLTDLVIYVRNDSANALALFPMLATDQINNLTIGTAISIPAGKAAECQCTGTFGRWVVVVSA